ncbi:MAG TPA: tetratricopeptide repeat protein [Planctomycetota bacterium]|nr:tetratricopeptide repeat protein [Planctomycetota bacterium]
MKNGWMILMGSCLLAGCGGLDERETEIFEEGRRSIEGKEWSAAQAAMTALLESEPDHVPALLLRGRVRFELRKYSDSTEDFARAEALGDLTVEERARSILYRGRCLIEQARLELPKSGTRPEDAARRARDLFLKANVTLLAALELRPEEYDIQLWRGYALLRLENYRKALDVLQACEKADAGRWEHRFFNALAWEGLYRINSQSLESYFAIVEGGPRPELAPVYEHLVEISSDVAPEVGRKIFTAIQLFAAKVSPSPLIASYLTGARARHETELKQDQIMKASLEIEDHLRKERFQEAANLINSLLADESSSPTLTKTLRDAGEGWSQLLEATTESLIGSGDREKLETALKNFELARTLTIRIDRLVVLQQKINAVQVAMNRQETSRKIQQAYQLLKGGKNPEVLEEVASMSTEGLTEKDRDLYHYLRGVASYNLGQWSAAARAFAAMGQRNFDNLDVFHGVALVRSGQETNGISLLENLPPEAMTEEVHRILGQHHAARGDSRMAVRHFSSIKAPSPAEIESHLQSRRKLGLEFYKNGDYTHAIEEFQAARQILEVQLHQKAVDVYLYLGNSYFRLEDFARAKKTYQDLSDTDLTAAEKSQCKDLYLHRGEIYVKEKHPDLAYQDFAEFVRLGGRIPAVLKDKYGRLVATYADYLPLDKVQYWNYTSTARDYSYTLYVKGSEGGEYKVERREAGNTSEETWSRKGIVLTRNVGETLMKLPINLNPAEEALPFLRYTSRGQDWAAEVVAIQQTVETPGGRVFEDCLKVRVRRTQKQPDGSVQSTKNIFYFAPSVGEVKQEVYRDDTKVSEIVLSDFVLKTQGTPGN